MVLSLAMLEGKMGNLDTGDETKFSGRLNGMKLGQDLAGVCGQGGEYLEAAKGEETNVGLGVGSELGLGDEADGVLQSLKSGGQEVSVPHVLRVVDADEKRLDVISIST
jgi:hypothetical protein